MDSAIESVQLEVRGLLYTLSVEALLKVSNYLGISGTEVCAKSQLVLIKRITRHLDRDELEELEDEGLAELMALRNFIQLKDIDSAVKVPEEARQHEQHEEERLRQEMIALIKSLEAKEKEMDNLVQVQQIAPEPFPCTRSGVNGLGKEAEFHSAPSAQECPQAAVEEFTAEDLDTLFQFASEERIWPRSSLNESYKPPPGDSLKSWNGQNCDGGPSSVAQEFSLVQVQQIAPEPFPCTKSGVNGLGKEAEFHSAPSAQECPQAAVEEFTAEDLDTLFQFASEERIWPGSSLNESYKPPPGDSLKSWNGQNCDGGPSSVAQEFSLVQVQQIAPEPFPCTKSGVNGLGKEAEFHSAPSAQECPQAAVEEFTAEDLDTLFQFASEERIWPGSSLNESYKPPPGDSLKSWNGQNCDGGPSSVAQEFSLGPQKAWQSVPSSSSGVTKPSLAMEHFTEEELDAMYQLHRISESKERMQPGASHRGHRKRPQEITMKDWLQKQVLLINCYTGGYNLRKKRRVRYTEKDEPKDEDYLFCEECQSYFLEKCKCHGQPIYIRDTPAELGSTHRARLTLPRGLTVRDSSIPGAGLGVFNDGKLIPKGVRFGPYEGEVSNEEKAVLSGYSWVINNGKKKIHYIDASSETNSNWMRFVNCARNEEEQNLVAFQYRDQIFYKSCKPIIASCELLVWYGEEFGQELGITWDHLWQNKCRPTDTEMPVEAIPEHREAEKED
ncbi:uncharacterized protein LOC136767331 [Amia ocellicauda]|uniref:uncharacterized protein LOC136767331 n=1 Tax=Amia ocellicauda TaxID=2972642 RepID=UPI003464DB77